jgi:glycosyltransferase involved in cell wall biosynthesis
LPIVLTDVPPVAKDIEKEGAGKIARYDAADFANAIASILWDANYLLIRENARRLGERYAWPKVFAEAFARIDEGEVEKQL